MGKKAGKICEAKIYFIFDVSGGHEIEEVWERKRAADVNVLWLLSELPQSHLGLCQTKWKLMITGKIKIEIVISCQAAIDEK